MSAVINGPFVIGYTLCFGLTGALSVQAYIYYTRFADDRKTIKALVTGVLLLETLMTVFVFYAFWESSTVNDSDIMNPLSLGAGVSWSFIGLAPATGLATTLTHGFFCWRISSLRNSRLLPLPIIMVSLLQLVSIIRLAFTDALLPSNEFLTMTSSPNTHYSFSLSPWLVTWLGSSVVCDLAITICMMLSLHASKFHSRGNRSILFKLTRLTIETGLVTTIAALLELILGIVYMKYFYHIAIFYAISKLYANCLLASLNFRLVLRSQCDPNLTAIVWDDSEMKSNTQSRQLGSRSMHVMQFLVREELDVDMVVDLNETGPRKTSSVEDQAPFSQMRWN